MAQAGETLKSFKQVADTLNSRLGAIMDGLARFSGQGLQRRRVAGARHPPFGQPHRAKRSPTSNATRSASSPAATATVRQYDGRARR